MRISDWSSDVCSSDLFPKYLHDARGFDIALMGLFASLPLMAGVVGDLMGGWASDLLVKCGAGLKMARRSVAVVGFLTAAAMIPLAAAMDGHVASILCFCIALFGLELTVRSEGGSGGKGCVSNVRFRG